MARRERKVQPGQIRLYCDDVSSAAGLVIMVMHAIEGERHALRILMRGAWRQSGISDNDERLGDATVLISHEELTDLIESESRYLRTQQVLAEMFSQLDNSRQGQFSLDRWLTD